MTTQNIIAGLQMLQKYCESGYGVDAAHDTLYFSCDFPPNDEDATELRALGWFVSEEYDEGNNTAWQAFP